MTAALNQFDVAWQPFRRGRRQPVFHGRLQLFRLGRQCLWHRAGKWQCRR
jgi:hypothetical protein